MNGPDAIDGDQVVVLGRLTVSTQGEEVDIGGPKQRLLLALLLADIGQAVTTEALIDKIWGDDSPVTARKAAQVHVSNLHRILGEAFPQRAAPGGYLIQCGELDFDAITCQGELDRASAVEAETIRLTELRFQALEVTAMAMSPRAVLAIDFSPDGDLMAASNLAGVTLWDSATWISIGSVDAPPGDNFTDIAFSSDGRLLVLMSEESSPCTTWRRERQPHSRRVACRRSSAADQFNRVLGR